MTKNYIHKNFALIMTVALVMAGLVGIVYSYRLSTQQKQKLDQIQASSEAPIAILDRTDHDWGNIPRQQIAEETFTLTNQGEMDLEISKLVTSCGCTTAELTINGKPADIPATIAPNSTGLIKVQFDPDAHDSRGQVKRAVRIETNDPNNPFLIINLQANVQ